MKTNEEIRTIVNEFFNDQECSLQEINIENFNGQKCVEIICGTLSFYSIKLLNKLLDSEPVILPNDKYNIQLDYWIF